MTETNFIKSTGRRIAGVPPPLFQRSATRPVAYLEAPVPIRLLETIARDIFESSMGSKKGAVRDRYSSSRSGLNPRRRRGAGLSSGSSHTGRKWRNGQRHLALGWVPTLDRSAFDQGGGAVDGVTREV